MDDEKELAWFTGKVEYSVALLLELSGCTHARRDTDEKFSIVNQPKDTSGWYTLSQIKCAEESHKAFVEREKEEHTISQIESLINKGITFKEDANQIYKALKSGEISCTE